MERLAIGLVVALQLGAGPAAAAGSVPAKLVPPAGFTAYFRAHAIGTQNYVCVATGSGLAWRFVGPQATLYVPFGPVAQQATTHFLSPNPEEAGVLRATWQGSLDTSRVWAKAIETVDDVAVTGTGNIPWLLLQRTGARRGPTGGAFLAQATYVQRLNTSGGAAPSTGCSQATDAGTLVMVPYSTDYVFYR